MTLHHATRSRASGRGSKLFVFGPAGTVGFFRSLGYPAIAAYFTVAVETGGGAD